MQEIYCKHFKHIRTKAGLKIETLSRLCHLSPAYLSQWENGKRRLEEAQISLLYKQFDLDFKLLKTSYKKNLPILEEAYRAILFSRDPDTFLEQIKNTSTNLEQSIEYPYYLALCFLTSCKTQEAKKYFTLINQFCDLLTDTSYNIYLLAQGIYWYCHNDPQQSLLLLNQIQKNIETSQIYALSQLFLSRIYRLNLQFSQAIRCNNQAEELFREAMNIPRFIECINQRGLIYLYNGSFINAIETFQEALRHAEFLQITLSDQNIHDNLTFSYLFSQSYDKVLELSHQVDLIVPGQPNASYFYIAWSYYKLGQEKECRELLSQAQLQPPHAIMTRELLTLLQSMIDQNEAKEEAQLMQCVKVATTSSTSIILIFIYQLSVDFYRRHSRYKRALHYSEKITQLCFGTHR